MELPVVNHESYVAKIGDDHKFPINKFGELAKYLINKKIVKKFYKPYPCSFETLKKKLIICTKVIGNQLLALSLRERF